MNFTPCFTKKQMAVFALVIYALFKDYKRNSLETMAKSSNINYQKLQCFMSDSKWDMQVMPEADSLWRTIKQKRLEITQKQRSTTSTKDGLISIDGTRNPKPFAKKTQGAKWQYCGSLKREEICNVAVAPAFVLQTKRFPIDIMPYLPAGEFKNGKDSPEFKDKIQIAIELFDNAIESLDIPGITFDTWHASNNLTHEGWLTTCILASLISGAIINPQATCHCACLISKSYYYYLKRFALHIKFVFHTQFYY
jgi:hypothetical protein